MHGNVCTSRPASLYAGITIETVRVVTLPTVIYLLSAKLGRNNIPSMDPGYRAEKRINWPE